MKKLFYLYVFAFLIVQYKCTGCMVMHLAEKPDYQIESASVSQLEMDSDMYHGDYIEITGQVVKVNTSFTMFFFVKSYELRDSNGRIVTVYVPLSCAVPIEGRRLTIGARLHQMSHNSVAGHNIGLVEVYRTFLEAEIKAEAALW